MESDTCYGDFMATIIWRLTGNLINYVFYMKTPDNFQTNFTIIKSLKNITLHTVSIQAMKQAMKNFQ